MQKKSKFIRLVESDIETLEELIQEEKKQGKDTMYLQGILRGKQEDLKYYLKDSE